jgi:hypothetical protein
MRAAIPTRRSWQPQPDWWRRRQEPPHRYRRRQRRPRAAITLVAGTAVSSTATASFAATCTSTTAGNDLVVTIAVPNTVNVVTVTDNATGGSSVYTKKNALQNLTAGAAIRSEIWIARNIKSAITTVTVKLSASAVVAVGFGEYSGLSSYGVINSAFNASTSTTPSVSLTTTGANNIVLGCLTTLLGGGTQTCTATAGTVEASNFTQTGIGIAFFDFLKTTAGSATLSGTLGTTDFWAFTAVELQLLSVSVPVPAAVWMTAGTGNKSSTAGTTMTCVMSSASGDPIVLGIAIPSASVTVSTVTDNVGGSVYTFLGRIIHATGIVLELWTSSLANPKNCGTITVTLSATGTTATCVGLSYWNANGIGQIVSAQGTSTAQSSGAVTLSTPGSAFVSVGAKTSTAAYTGASNNTRGTQTTTGIRAIMQDGSSSPVTNSATLASGAWALIGCEIQPSPYPPLQGAPRTLPQPHVLVNF